MLGFTGDGRQCHGVEIHDGSPKRVLLLSTSHCEHLRARATPLEY